MSSPAPAVALVVNGRPISLAEALHSWKIDGRLENLLAQLVEEHLILEACREARLSLSDAELQQAADAFRRKHGLHRAAETERWLEQHGLNIEDLQARVEKPLLRRKLIEHLTGSQVDRYFAEHRSDFDRARLSQLVVVKEGIASELLSQILEDGADFSSLVRKYSIDEASRHAGGSLGVVARKSLNPPVEAAVFGARPGDVVGPFHTAQGYHLLRVEELLPAQLDAATRETIQERIFADWLRQRKSRSSIEFPLLGLTWSGSPEDGTGEQGA